jgi:hypothetical protein
MTRKKIEEMRKKYKLELFERAIIKMQMGEHSFFRYGGRSVLGDYSRFDYFAQEGILLKWEGQFDTVDMLDLNIFLATLMIPMANFVFSNFSYQSNVYKVMLGFAENLGEMEIKSSLEMLRNTIHKRLTIKKFPSINACINSGKKKRIIFICKPNAFEEIMDDLIGQISHLDT